MKVKYLSRFRKRLNAILTLAIIFSFLPVIIISLILHFDNNENSLAAALMIISLIAMTLAIVLGILGLINRSVVTLGMDPNYVLEVNSDKDPSAITKASEIQYCGNFIKNEILNVTIEIDNKITFSLMKEKLFPFNKIKTEKRKTKFLESSPRALFSEFLESMGSYG